MKSSFGNYVIQKALKIAVNENKAKLVETILNHVDKLGESKLIKKWKKIVEDSFINNASLPSEKKNPKKVKKSSAKNVNSNLNKNNFNNNLEFVYNLNNQNYSNNNNNKNNLSLNYCMNANMTRSFSGSPINSNKNNFRQSFNNNIF